MKVIVTKYRPATNTKGSGFSAKVEGKPPAFFPYDHEFETYGNHRNAAKALAEQLGLIGKWTGGSLPDGSYVWVQGHPNFYVDP